VGEIQTLKEGPRGCGHRREGGLYMMGGPFNAPCGRLPMPIDRCPTCDHGLKQTRSLQWFAPASFWEAEAGWRCRGMPDACCAVCPNGLAMPERAGLMWIGVKHYPTPTDFLEEARAHGVSKRIPALPKEVELGVTRVFLAHPRAFTVPCPNREPDASPDRVSLCRWVRSDRRSRPTNTPLACPVCKGETTVYRAGVIGSFVPDRIEKVVGKETTEEDAEVLRDRGITPVRVEPTEDWGAPAQTSLGIV